MPNSHHRQQWEIDRYVLGDPTQDRQRFESEMLDDPELALAVAESVKEMQSLTVIQALHETANPMETLAPSSFSSRVPEQSPVGRAAGGGRQNSLLGELASVAVILVIVGTAAYRESLQNDAWSQDRGLKERGASLATKLDPRVVRSWLVFEQPEFEQRGAESWDVGGSPDLLLSDKDPLLGQASVDVGDYDLLDADDSQELLAANETVSEGEPLLVREDSDWIVEAAQAFYLQTSQAASEDNGFREQGS